MSDITCNPELKTAASRHWPKILGWIVAWVWAIVAGGGGLMLLMQKGPLPLTNGWYALLSGVSVCPLTAWLLKKLAGLSVSGRVRFAVAAGFFVAGRIALAFR